MLLLCLDMASTLPWCSGWHTIPHVDMVCISLTWLWAWYMLPIYLGLAYPLYILVADISLSWIMADGDSSAGRTGLGSEVLDGVVIGLGLHVGRLLLGKHLISDLASILHWHSGWCSLLYILVADISLSWIMADGDSSAGRTGLGSALLDSVIIGLGLHVGRLLLGKHLVLTSIS